MSPVLAPSAVALLIGYLLGSVLPAFLIGRAKGVDIRAVGDGNPGATNVRDVFGAPAGYATLAVDMLKAPLAVAVGFAIGAPEPVAYGAGLAAFLGHRYPFYLRFRGGRGFACAAGLLAAGLVFGVWRGYLPAVDGLVFLGLFLALWWRFGDRAVPDATVLPLAFADLAWRNVSPAFTAGIGVVAAYVWLHNIRRVRDEGLLGPRRD